MVHIIFISYIKSKHTNHTKASEFSVQQRLIVFFHAFFGDNAAEMPVLFHPFTRIYVIYRFSPNENIGYASKLDCLRVLEKIRTENNISNDKLCDAFAEEI